MRRVCLIFSLALALNPGETSVRRATGCERHNPTGSEKFEGEVEQIESFNDTVEPEEAEHKWWEDPEDYPYKYYVDRIELRMEQAGNPAFDMHYRLVKENFDPRLSPYAIPIMKYVSTRDRTALDEVVDKINVWDPDSE